MGVQADAIQLQLEHGIAEIARSLVIRLAAKLYAATPVDTGRARSNWISSIGSPFTGEVGDDTRTLRGVTEIAGYVLSQGPLWLVNNVPYINLLDMGYSKQAPAGFVEMAMDEALREVQDEYATDIGLGAYRGDVGGQMAGNLAAAYAPFP